MTLPSVLLWIQLGNPNSKDEEKKKEEKIDDTEEVWCHLLLKSNTLNKSNYFFKLKKIIALINIFKFENTN